MAIQHHPHSVPPLPCSLYTLLRTNGHPTSSSFCHTSPLLSLYSTEDKWPSNIVLILPHFSLAFLILYRGQVAVQYRPNSVPLLPCSPYTLLRTNGCPISSSFCPTSPLLSLYSTEDKWLSNIDHT
ncbi:hypothetical protein PoB_001661100 [Plakobranchus ocellatus]|uniref:Uncharacterized protein n=1 Tax=Plakobranchus ocellatus TaxID=259542 RepID=A0AAV3Z2L8_9GAST|nr:hypothetical protein PoB_001661100 [Plakobranchus ocellatus]